MRVELCGLHPVSGSNQHSLTRRRQVNDLVHLGILRTQFFHAHDHIMTNIDANSEVNLGEPWLKMKVNERNARQTDCLLNVIIFIRY